MEKILYIDCFSGISGDMMVGALLDLGLDLSYLKNELKNLNLNGYSINCIEIKIGSIKAKKFNVKVNLPQPHRDYKEIKKIISKSSLDADVKKNSLGVFGLIAEAEAKVHGIDIDKIHFHEVGAVDSIIDIVSASIGISKLGLDLIYCQSIPLGKGIASAMHGNIPIPAPATLEILKGVPVYGGNFNFEVTTPTGAAILKFFVTNFSSIPLMRIERVGIGAGSRKNKDCPNILRLMKGSLEKELISYENDLILISTNIDDSSPEILGYLLERLLEKKALDAWVEPIYMKKNRPAFKLCVICRLQLEKEILDIIFNETSTLGVRVEKIKRYCTDRKIKTVKLPYGEVNVKIGIYQGREITFSPEFESCVKLARKIKKPLKEIYRDAIFFLSKK